jgi:hypothetical protein
MTNESKENLLKILVNEEEEQPGSYTPNFVKTKEISSNLPTGYINMHQFNNKYIYVTSYAITLLDENFNILVQQDYTNNLTISGSCLDEEGNLYIFYSRSVNNKTRSYIGYLNNMTQKYYDGTYKIEIKKAFDISTILLASVGGTAEYFNFIPNQAEIYKSPYNSEFLLVVSDTTFSPTQLTIIKISISFDNNHSYEYKRITVPNSATKKSMDNYISWGTSNVSYKFIIYCSNLVEIYPKDVTIIEVSGNMNNATYRTLRSGLRLAGRPTGTYGPNGVIYLGYIVNNDTTDTLYITKDTTTIQVKQLAAHTPTILNVPVHLKCVNGEIYGLESKGNGYKAVLLHIIDTTIYEFNLEDVLYPDTILVTQNYNIFSIISLEMFKIMQYNEIYNTEGYNGPEYFSDKSTTSESATIDNEEMTIFARDLKDKNVINNVVTSTMEVPYYYLNNEEITNNSLLSKCKNIIAKLIKKIKKNSYEELNINYIDVFKVFDNNNGSVYNQESSNIIAKQVYNGFEEKYKITNYRINYSDNTHKDEKIVRIQRNGNIATIYLYIYADKQIDNIQLYDSNYTTPFVTIKPSLELNKLYVITQKVKVE